MIATEELKGYKRTYATLYITLVYVLTWFGSLCMQQSLISSVLLCKWKMKPKIHTDITGNLTCDTKITCALFFNHMNKI
jgi:hypothetical protein